MLFGCKMYCFVNVGQRKRRWRPGRVRCWRWAATGTSWTAATAPSAAGCARAAAAPASTPPERGSSSPSSGTAARTTIIPFESGQPTPRTPSSSCSWCFSWWFHWAWETTSTFKIFRTFMPCMFLKVCECIVIKLELKLVHRIYVFLACFENILPL